MVTKTANDATAPDSIHAHVRERYASAALQVLQSPVGNASCCGGDASGASCCGPMSTSAIVTGHYSASDTEGLPDDAVRASLGCGNPLALATLQEGETVLDLGSGGGIDVLLSARRVGPTGRVYGLDMTDEMLALAERNRQAAGASGNNAIFLKGTIEDIPLPAASVDIIISNCVINLAADKDAVFAEAFRVLRPGGRFAVSDMVVQGSIDDTLRANLDAWAGCISGALEEQDYLARLTAAGFVDASTEVTRTYTETDLTDAAGGCCGTPVVADGDAAGTIVSAFIRARKP